MSHIDHFQLRKLIPHEEFDYTLLKSILSPYTGVRQKIHQLLKDGVIVRVKKGLYTFGPSYNLRPIYKEVLANLIYGPSCISLEYALSFYGLIPERVERVTSITPKKDKLFDTPIGIFQYRYLNIEKYPVGIQQVWLDEKHPVLIASPEKAICDLILLNKISNWKSLQEVGTYLLEDLRIDQHHWKTLNFDHLFEIQNKYKNKNIKLLCDFIFQEKS